MANLDTVVVAAENYETIIGTQTKFKGIVKTDKDIRIDGYFEGTLETTATVIISPTGVMNGILKCNVLKLQGKGYGNAFCTNLCDIAPGGYFEGDVTTADLITVKGSLINGRIIITN